jgi:hypothetical protein
MKTGTKRVNVLGSFALVHRFRARRQTSGSLTQTHWALLAIEATLWRGVLNAVFIPSR